MSEENQYLKKPMLEAIDEYLLSWRFSETKSIVTRMKKICRLGIPNYVYENGKCATDYTNAEKLETIGDFLKHGEDYYIKAPTMGRKSLIFLKELLWFYGLRLEKCDANKQ